MMNQGLRELFAKHGAAPALLSQDGQTISFERLGRIVSSFAARLDALDIQPGQRVAPIVENTVLRLAMIFAIWRRGADAVLTDDPKRLLARGILVEHVIAAPTQPLADGPKWHLFNQDWLAPLETPEKADVPGGRMTFGTSGSTGLPKYMSQVADYWFQLAQAYAKSPYVGSGHRMMAFPAASSALPVYTLLGMFAGWGTCFMSGSVTQTLAAAKGFGATLLNGPPALIADILAAAEEGAPHPDFAAIGFTGAAIAPDMLGRLQKTFNATILVTAGANEIGGLSAGVYAGGNMPAGWAGKVLPGVVFELRDQAAYADLGQGAGRLAVKVPQVQQMDGYLGGARIYDADGWAETGDVVSVDDDQTVRYLGRVDFLINIGGAKFAPELIEALAQSVEGIVAAGAAPIRSVAGDRLALLVVARDGTDIAALRSRITDRIVDASALELRVVPFLPMLAAGKLDRHAIAALAASAD